MFRLLFVVLAWFFIPGVILAENVAKETVKIGFIIPLTGGLAMRGEDLSRLAEFMLPKLNKESQKYNYEFVFEDGKCGIGNGSISAANKFINIDHLKFVITGCSGETMQAGPLLNRNKVLTVAVMANHQKVSELGEFIFRNFPPNQDLVRVVSEQIEKDKNIPIGVITEENAFTIAIDELLMSTLGASAISLGQFPFDSSDYRTLLLKAKTNGVHSLFFNCASARTCAPLFIEARQLGLRQQVYMYNFAGEHSFLDAVGKEANGIRYVSNSEVPANAAQEFKDLMSAYLARYPQGPSFPLMVAGAYDGLSMMAQSIEKYGPDSEKARQFFVDYQGQGAIGYIKYDSNRNIIGLSHVMKEVRDGQPVSLP